jgi:hypothetical protein
MTSTIVLGAMVALPLSMGESWRAPARGSGRADGAQ